MTDPTNPGFVYQRFERGVLMYNRRTGSSQWMPMGDEVKSLFLGQGQQAGLTGDAASSAHLRQHDPSKANGVARPSALPSPNLVGAFTPDA